MSVPRAGNLRYGRASIAFTDGKNIGAVLDRNGLRPSRCEEGVLITANQRVLAK